MQRYGYFTQPPNNMLKKHVLKHKNEVLLQKRGNLMNDALSKIKNNYSFYPDNVRVEYRNGQKCGIYIDEENKEHVVSNICPHMKCNLVFNYIDRTWDCPCHASRFDIDGKVISGPSNYSISVDK